MEGAIKHSAEKQPDTTQPYALRLCRNKVGMDIPLQGVPSSLKLRRDKAIGVTRQRNRKAGSAVAKGYGKTRERPLQKNQSAFSTQPFN